MQARVTDHRQILAISIFEFKGIVNSGILCGVSGGKGTDF